MLTQLVSFIELKMINMKEIFLGIFVFLISGSLNHTSAQSTEVQQLLLNVEKLAQFKQILNDMKKVYDILNGGYNVVKDISKGNFSLHKTFLDGLMAVSPAVKKYRRVSDIINLQIRLVKDYKSALKRFRLDKNFNDDELAYIGRIYTKLFDQSLTNIDNLTMVVTANKLRMSDDERLEAIDKIYDDMQDKVSFLQNFNKETSLLSLQRAKVRNDAVIIGGLHGINN